MNGVKQYPGHAPLKIDFAWFLLSKMMNKRDALKELISAEKQSRSFSESFIIFRYRQIIEDELYEGAEVGGLGMLGAGSALGGGGMDYVAALNYTTHFKELRHLIDRSATMHYDFWTSLLDE
jgi:hypothetical protein